MAFIAAKVIETTARFMPHKTAQVDAARGHAKTASLTCDGNPQEVADDGSLRLPVLQRRKLSLLHLSSRIGVEEAPIFVYTPRTPT